MRRYNATKRFKAVRAEKPDEEAMGAIAGSRKSHMRTSTIMRFEVRQAAKDLNAEANSRAFTNIAAQAGDIVGDSKILKSREIPCGIRVCQASCGLAEREDALAVRTARP